MITSGYRTAVVENSINSLTTIPHNSKILHIIADLDISRNTINLETIRCKQI